MSWGRCLLGGLPSDQLGPLCRDLRSGLPGPLAFTLGALVSLYFRKDAEEFLRGLLGHEFTVVLEEHLWGVACLEGNLSCRLGDGQAVGAEGVTEAIVDEREQRLALSIDQLGGGVLEELGEVELVTDAGEDWAGLASRLQPSLQSGDNGCEPPCGCLGLVLTNLNDPLVEPDVFPLQAENLNRPQSGEPS